MKEIKGFQGQYRWLSNFAASRIVYNGHSFPTVEHAYQAAKAWHSPLIRDEIMKVVTPALAKKLGSTVQLRPNWDATKLEIMKYLLEQKFNLPEFKDKLLATGNAYIEETNYWGDRFWGVCRGVGQNNLGKLIMSIRASLAQR